MDEHFIPTESSLIFTIQDRIQITDQEQAADHPARLQGTISNESSFNYPICHDNNVKVEDKIE